MIFIWYLKIIITFAAQLASGYRPGNLSWAEGERKPPLFVYSYEKISFPLSSKIINPN
jgi:hypothetical protein